MVARWLVGTVGILAAATALGACSKKQPTAQRPPDKPPEITTVIAVGWGSSPGQLGATSPEEASPEGPKSFVVDASGRIHVLDQVHARIQTFEQGKSVATLPLPARPFEDIELEVEWHWEGVTIGTRRYENVIASPAVCDISGD